MTVAEAYRVLGLSYTNGVPPNTDEVKKAYKQLARKYHPDMNKGRDTSTEFVQCAEAYKVLTETDVSTVNYVDMGYSKPTGVRVAHKNIFDMWVVEP